MKSNYSYVVIALILCGILIMFDIQQAYAFSLDVYDIAGNDPTGIARIGNNIWIADETTNTLYKRSVADPSTTIATVALTTSPQLLGVSSGGRLFAFGTTNLFEIDPVNNAVLRTLAHGCSASAAWFDKLNDRVWCGTATETINRINLASMAIDFTSTTLNAGATPCDTFQDMWYDTATDTLFATCIAGTNRIVAVEGLTVSGTPDFAVTLASVREIVFNNQEDNIAICSASSTVSAQLYNYTAGVGFTFWKQLLPTGTSNVCLSTSIGALDFDLQTDRFFLQAGGFDTINVFDATNGNSLFSQTITGIGGGQFYVHSSLASYISIDGGTTEDFAVFDMTGISLGSGGSTIPDGTGGIDCSLPENAQILICRLGSDPNCNGTVLSCVGNIVLGNSTDDSDSGLIDVICGVGFIDCNANPDIKTNGIGYLLLAVALGIEIGILWVASRGDLRQVPTFIWFIATIAIIAALTLFNWIDATMLVLGVIVAVALAAAKARGFFGGDSF